jgi:GWxTD domain-containing protein
MRYSRFFLLLTVFCFGLGSLSSTPAEKDEGKSKSSRKNRQDESQSKYFKRWLDEDAIYIISDDEKSVFKNLKNDEERESFIDQFWNRRNPDPRSPNNAFKEEHYRRIAYANERFASGIPGWKTDRGRIYIMHGPPDQLESHPTGGIYDRPFNEGGGTTTTFPFEKWWYRHIDGIGDDVELEFVDASLSGEYRLAMTPEEKDALINVPNAGLTLAEEMGLSDKKDRAYFNPGAWNDPNSIERQFARAKDSPFSRMEQYFSVQRPPQIKFKDLKTAVSTHITYDMLAYDFKTDFIKLSPERILVPITLQLNNADLEFRREQDFNRAKVNVYGIVTSLSGRIAAEWEDEITRDFNDLYFHQGKDKLSKYQRIVALAPGQRYRLDLIVKDVNSKKIGTVSQGLVVPKYDEVGLQSSTIILADNITPAPMNATQLDQYVIGDMRISPRVKPEYVSSQHLVPYMQVYNMQIDQTTQRPDLEVTYVIKSGNRIVQETKSSALNSEQFFYGQRVVLVARLPLKGIAPGKYSLEIQVRDNIGGNSLATSADFKVTESAPSVVSAAP